MDNAGPHRALSCVALLSPAWPVELLPNGIGTYAAQIRAGFDELRVRSVILTGRYGGDSSQPDVIDWAGLHSGSRLTRLYDRLRYRNHPSIQAQRRRARRMRAAVQQAIQAHGVQLIETSEWDVIGNGATLTRRVPVVVRLHGPWFLNGRINGVAEDANYHWRIVQEGRTIAAAAGVTAPSQDVLERTRAFYGIDLPDAAVIPNPITPVPPAQQWRIEDCERNRILFVGRFDRHKGGDIAIDAIKQLCQQRPDCRLTFVGPDRGCVDDAGRQWSLPDYVADRLGAALAERHLETPGSLPPKDIAALRQTAMVSIVPSRYETFGFTALESMAQGMPTIVSDVGGLAEIVTHERNGLTVAPGDANALAQAIQRVLDDPDLARRLGAQASADALERYHPTAVAARTCAYYEQVLVNRGAPLAGRGSEVRGL